MSFPPYDPTATYTFTPPLVNVVPRFLPTDTGQQKALFRFYKPSAAYVQVFILSDMSCVQNFPTPENSNTNIPYPWNINDPSGPFAWGTYVDYTVSPPQSKYFSESHEVYITELLDRPQKISGNIANILVASNAGYAGGNGFTASIS